jgi:hypothetical protein
MVERFERSDIVTSKRFNVLMLVFECEEYKGLGRDDVG